MIHDSYNRQLSVGKQLPHYTMQFNAKQFNVITIINILINYIANLINYIANLINYIGN